MPMEAIWGVVGIVVGALVGFLVMRFVSNSSTKRAAQEAKDLLAKAKSEAETTVSDAEHRAEKDLQRRVPQHFFQIFKILF